jgi:ubiquitin carboxyl-terminal hydrolase 25/28
LERTAAYLSSQDGLDLPEADEGLFVEIKAERDRITSEIDECRARASALKQQLEDVWQDEARAEYELTSVFVHRGSSPSFGHYFIYQRWLPDYPESWFKYNDSDVTIVHKDEVLADTTGSIANPYLVRLLTESY